MVSSAREMGDYVKIAVAIACLALLADIIIAVWCCRSSDAFPPPERFAGVASRDF